MDAWIDRFGGQALLMIVAAVLALGGRDWIKRVRSGTRRIAAEDEAQVSVLADEKARSVQWVLREAQLLQRIDILVEQVGALSRKVAESDKRLTVLSMLASADPERTRDIMLESGFLDLDRPLRPRPAPRPAPAPSDPFHAADPFAPPVLRSRVENPGDLRMIDSDQFHTRNPKKG